MTVIESARRAAGLSQRRLAELARTQQSSVSEYESRRTPPALEVVERLLDAADAELAVKPLVEFDYLENPELGSFPVPNRLWPVPAPLCFSRVQVRDLFATVGDDKVPSCTGFGECCGPLDLAGVDEDLTASMQLVEHAGGVVAGPHAQAEDGVVGVGEPVHRLHRHDGRRVRPSHGVVEDSSAADGGELVPVTHERDPGTGLIP